MGKHTRRVFIALLLAGAAHAHHEEGEAYRRAFQKAWLDHWSDTEHTWQQIEELARAESSFRPNVVSWAGAVGLTQVMPGTWREIKQHVPIGDDMTDPADNARAGAFYLRKQYNIYHPDRTENDRIKYSLASYNAGAGNVIEAQKLAQQKGRQARIFDDIKPTLPQVTGEHAAGTIQYSEKIVTRYRQRQQQEKPVVQDVGQGEAETGSSPPLSLAPQAQPVTIHIHQQDEQPVDWQNIGTLVAYLLIRFTPERKEDG